MHGPEIALNLLTFGLNKKDQILLWCRIANLHPSLRASDNYSGTLEAAWQCCMQESSVAACRRMIYVRISVQQHMENYIWCVDVMKTVPDQLQRTGRYDKLLLEAPGCESNCLNWKAGRFCRTKPPFRRWTRFQRFFLPMCGAESEQTQSACRHGQTAALVFTVWVRRPLGLHGFV